MKGLRPFCWNTDMDSLCRVIDGKVVFVFGWIDEAQMNAYRTTFQKYFNMGDSVVNKDRRICSMKLE